MAMSGLNIHVQYQPVWLLSIFHKERREIVKGSRFSLDVQMCGPIFGSNQRYENLGISNLIPGISNPAESGPIFLNPVGSNLLKITLFILTLIKRNFRISAIFVELFPFRDVVQSFGKIRYLVYIHGGRAGVRGYFLEN